ncbi:cell division protein FtsQ/DivIB [Glaciecola sp. KUL10]|uniref:cell division protein FtsQ/DivIB n=1 Tax=Glaciecola sp. (strain KUL10) TaxID=2161813 RepID=UPI000D784A1A|nr:cell division protein FtsQ/DivIB [Glaciecola sp. KUL10]GBL05625.1 cell division protein [Glaciecola sp. KUL10]
MNKQAISTVEQEREKPNFWIGLSVFVCVIILLVIGIFKVNEWLQDEQRLPVQKVVFSGVRNVLDDQRLENIIRQEQTGSFFALDVNDVHALLEGLPWVYRASVRKRWPNSLHVYLVEQTPAATWNDDLLLNEAGEPFDGAALYSLGYTKKLPSIFGPGGSEKTALAGLSAMQLILSNTGLRVEQLFLSERFAWRVELNNNIQLNLGRKEFIDRLQRFIDVYPLLREQNKQINYIDLRYDTGLAVGWGESIDSAPENS